MFKIRSRHVQNMKKTYSNYEVDMFNIYHFKIIQYMLIYSYEYISFLFLQGTHEFKKG